MTKFVLFFSVLIMCGCSMNKEALIPSENEQMIKDEKNGSFDNQGNLLEGIKVDAFLSLLAEKSLIENYATANFIDRLNSVGYKEEYFEMSIIAPILSRIEQLKPNHLNVKKAINNLGVLADGEWASIYDHYFESSKTQSFQIGER